MSDQLLPPGSFKPPTRADFKDDSVPSGESKSSGENMSPRFSILQSEDRVRTYAVLDRIDRVVAFTAYVNRAVEILKDAQFNPSQSKKSWCWTPFTGIHREKYTEMTEEEIRAATIAPDAPNGTDSQITGTGGKSPAGVFTSSPCGTDSCVGASPLHDGLKQGHRQLDTPLYGDKTPWSMATITSGPYAGKDVVISFEFSDGWCVVDLGDSGQGDEGAHIVHIDCMRLWVPVRSVAVRDGQTWFDPIQTKGLE